ncbi:MAG: hypothetical protein ABIH18_05620 [Candidatus Omnitrophota bacterium]
MRLIAKSIFITAVFLMLISSFVYCQTVSINDLLKQYNNATEVQKQEIIDTYKYKSIAVRGSVEDVQVWASFDERSDKPGRYYKVNTKQQTLEPGVSYQIIIFYKDKSIVDSFIKGQQINTNGALVKIIDEPGMLSVWVYADELTPEDKVMFGAYL